MKTYEDKVLAHLEGTVRAMQYLHENALETGSTNVDLWANALRSAKRDLAKFKGEV